VESEQLNDASLSLLKRDRDEGSTMTLQTIFGSVRATQPPRYDRTRGSAEAVQQALVQILINSKEPVD
jgi:hypothetical protein